MKWVVKAAIQNVLSVMPYGGLMNYFLQRHASRTLPQPDDKFLKQVERASRHYRHFRQYVPGADGGDACFYEFGAGWDMTIPLIYRALGIQRQRLIDIRPILRMNLIGDTLSKITRLRTAVEELTGAPVPPVFESTAKMSDADRSVLHDFGIEYLAPHDARHTGFEDACFDFISSTDTLEHIPRNDVSSILSECCRLLRPGGVMSSLIDLRDHYSYFDPNLSVYAFLHYSDVAWRMLNPSLHYQNRLRAGDYRELFAQNDWEIVRFDEEEPDEREAAELARIRLARRFRESRNLLDVGVKSLWVVVRRR